VINMASEGMNQVIETQLKCYACGSGPRAGKLHYWYKCLSSHQMCESCARVVCRCGGGITIEHCKMTEALLKLKTMQFKCSNQTHGCQETSGEEAMVFHEEECIYRMVKCPAIDCKLKVPFHELPQHMKDKENHIFRQYSILKGDKHLHQNEVKSFYTNCNWSPVVFEFDGRIFYNLIRKKEQIFYHWIQFYGYPNEAKNYTYTLEYHANDASQSTCVYTNRVIPIDQTSNSITSSFKCFTMTFGMMKAQFMDKDDKFKYSVQIRNLKEEVKDDNVESGISDDE